MIAGPPTLDGPVATRDAGGRKRSPFGWGSLTPSELDVVRLVKLGLTNPQIAARRFVSKYTVMTHLTHVFQKVGVSSRTELAYEAARRGL